MINTQRLKFPAVSFAVLALAIAGCGKGNEPAVTEKPAEPVATAPQQSAAPVMTPDLVSFNAPALYPEGVEYDAKGQRFLVTSLHAGTVGAVKDDGSYSIVFQDPAMVSAVGLRVDAARDRVLVCNSDPGVSVHTKKETQGKLAGVAAFQLSTGALIKYVDLGALAPAGGHFCNDIIIGADGNAYVSDSFSPILYKIDPAYNASILLNNDRFKGDGFNLNGLVIKDDFLIVTKYNDGLLFKIPLADPGKFSEIKLDMPLIGADGLLWNSDGSLVVIANLQTNKVFKLTSADNWSSATIAASTDTGPVFPTTGVARDGATYVLHAMLQVLFNPETKQHVEKFDIRKYVL